MLSDKNRINQCILKGCNHAKRLVHDEFLARIELEFSWIASAWSSKLFKLKPLREHLQKMEWLDKETMK
jgi:hypothetical protein